MSRWADLRAAFARPYPVTAPMIALMAMVPAYLWIAATVRTRPLHVPALPIDDAMPLVPAWAFVYGMLYLFLILLPVVSIRDEAHIRATFAAYLTVWCVAYACFLAYPTVAPRPREIAASGFTGWALRFLYAADPPMNCFPSLHVAHSFVSAFACRRLHRRLGDVAIACAALVAVSTLFTRQHYVADVIAGVALAWGASFAWLRNVTAPPEDSIDHRAVPALALCTAAIVLAAGGCYIAAFLAGFNPS